MRLSVIIVSYNVREYLAGALTSLILACRDIETEFFVVDNASSDDSVDYVTEHFPEVKLIANTVNAGFSVANNQAIRQATGEYILLINPDTITPPDTIQKCLSFIDDHPEAGGLGVRMINGEGKFLPESKRGLPTPLTAIFKLTGINSLFPQSRFFNRYYMGWVKETETTETDVLAGAFMLLRRKALDKVGLLDERFFMYGEDIDLSYRLQKAGYKNYYLADTYIIHFKGQSTRKWSWLYVKNFYGAMFYFAKKYFC